MTSPSYNDLLGMKRFLLSLLFAIYSVAVVISVDDTIAMDSTIRHQHFVVTIANVSQKEQTNAVNFSNVVNSKTIINWIVDLLDSTKV